MMEIQRNGAFTTEMLDSTACAGIRGIQQVHRSRSTSCLGGLPKRQRGRTRSIVRQAKQYMTAPGFEAELIAAKLLGRRGAAGFKDCLPSTKPTEPIPAMQVDCLAEYSSFRFKLSSNLGPHFKAEFVTSKLPNTTGEATHKPLSQEFRFKPSVGTWILPRTMVLACDLHKQINEEVLAPYAPRLQARNQLHLTSLENALSVTKISEVAPYAPRLQQRGCLHLAFLEDALSGETKLDIAPYAPRLQARSHLYLESLESALSVAKSSEAAPYAPRQQERSHLHLANLADAWSTLQTSAAHLHLAHLRGEKKSPTSHMASMPQSAFDAIHAAFPRAERKEEVNRRQKVNYTTNMLSMPKSAFDAIYSAFPNAERKEEVGTKLKADCTRTMLSMPKTAFDALHAAFPRAERKEEANRVQKVAPLQPGFSECPAVIDHASRPTAIVHAPMLLGPMMYSCGGCRPMPFFM